MANKHARLSPSSAARWTTCTASPSASDGLPNNGNAASRSGTCCHQIQEEMLLDPSRELSAYIGREMWFGTDGSGRVECWREQWPHTDIAPEHVVEVTEEMVEAVASAVAYITQMVALHGGELLVEQRVPIGQFTGEADAYGSADVVIL